MLSCIDVCFNICVVISIFICMPTDVDQMHNTHEYTFRCVFIFVLRYVYVYVYIRVFVCTSSDVYLQMYIFRCIFTCVLGYAYVSVYIRVFVCRSSNVYLQMYIHMCIEIFVCICVHSYVRV